MTNVKVGIATKTLSLQAWAGAVVIKKNLWRIIS
jgi:hypothetical protein